MARRVILDVDTGTDDAGALLLAATSPGLDLVAALATWGNTTSAQAARNTLALLAEADRPDVAVHPGAEGPRGPTPTAEDASDLMGSDGLGGLGIADRVLGRGGRGEGAAPSPEPAPAALVRLARQYPGEITLIAVAPLSTVAAALVLDPGLPGLLAGVVVMGGAITAGGNLTPAAEANVGHDPASAAEVIAAFGAPGALASGRPPRLVPLEATLASALTLRELEAMASSPLPGAGVVAEAWRAIWPSGWRETAVEGAWPAHDLLAAWCVEQPEVCEWADLPVAVDTGGSHGWGATVADQRVTRFQRLVDPGDAAALAALYDERKVDPGRWSVAVGVDAEAFRSGVRRWLSGK